ncbi:MAG TPA: hypothetical protein VM597_00060 [Gemmataceae bacterium]|jgi:hypothetical protein|nr:hypothetical protein [Gemmataceae bacterium]
MPTLLAAVSLLAFSPPAVTATESPVGKRVPVVVATPAAGPAAKPHPFDP